jgi:hypothetical protein
MGGNSCQANPMHGCGQRLWTKTRRRRNGTESRKSGFGTGDGDRNRLLRLLGVNPTFRKRPVNRIFKTVRRREMMFGASSLMRPHCSIHSMVPSSPAAGAKPARRAGDQHDLVRRADDAGARHAHWPRVRLAQQRQFQTPTKTTIPPGRPRGLPPRAPTDPCLPN